MKNVKFLLLLLMSFALVFSACKKDDDDNTDPTPTTGFSISGYSQDAINFNGIAGSMVTVLDANGAQVSSVTTDASGNYLITGIAPGTYTLTVAKDGYQNQMASNVMIGNANIPQAFVGFMPVDNSITVPVGAICGIVLDASGNPMANATIAISAEDESLTNGYFASGVTDAMGRYAIGAVPIESTVTGEAIPAFKIKAIQGNFVDVQHNVSLVQNSLVVGDVNLVTQNVPGNTIFTEGFEAKSDWTWEGFWHLQQNMNIMNSNVTAQYVKLAPNDVSQGYIPAAYAGSYCAWYGQESTGSFIGDAVVGQEQWSGGTGMESNKGSLTSSPIDLSGLNQASLSFWSWFEIESVNPNEYGFDIMEVYIIDVATSAETSILRLNPFSDPILEDRAPLPFTSGGFNKAPVWTMIDLDLSEFAGANIQIKFEFRTVDDLFNGFRGWFIDNVLVTDKAPLKSMNVKKVYGPDPAPRH
jgi:hypothetical protein